MFIIIGAVVVLGGIFTGFLWEGGKPAALFQPAELVLLALSGVVIAVAGALIPAGWAARTRTASALRAE